MRFSSKKGVRAFLEFRGPFQVGVEQKGWQGGGPQEWSEIFDYAHKREHSSRTSVGAEHSGATFQTLTPPALLTELSHIPKTRKFAKFFWNKTTKIQWNFNCKKSEFLNKGWTRGCKLKLHIRWNSSNSTVKFSIWQNLRTIKNNLTEMENWKTLTLKMLSLSMLK